MKDIDIPDYLDSLSENDRRKIESLRLKKDHPLLYALALSMALNVREAMFDIVGETWISYLRDALAIFFKCDSMNGFDAPNKREMLMLLARTIRADRRLNQQDRDQLASDIMSVETLAYVMEHFLEIAKNPRPVYAHDFQWLKPEYTAFPSTADKTH